MERNGDDELIKREAEMMGLTLSDSDVQIIKEKWYSNPLCRLRDLLVGIRRLRDIHNELAAMGKE